MCLALVAPEAGEARGGAKFEGFSALVTCHIHPSEAEPRRLTGMLHLLHLEKGCGRDPSMPPAIRLFSKPRNEVVGRQGTGKIVSLCLIAAFGT